MPLSIPYNPPVTEPEILFIDNDLLIVNKPAGLLSVPGRGELKKDCLISRIQKKYPEALIVHRLDMPTSGILILARSAPVQTQLGKQFQNREISKQYIAIVNGIIENSHGEIDLPLITDWPNRPKQKVDFETGKASLTRYEVINTDSKNNTTRLMLFPVTGRSHQLRVHLLSIGHSIVGDKLYSDNPDGSTNNTHSRLLLHASKVTFNHPVTHKKLSINCKCDF